MGIYNDDEPIVLPPGTTRPTVPGRVQLVIRNNNKAPLEENIQKVVLELTGEEKSRSGLDLVAVLDVGYCMDENMLAELKRAMVFVMKKLSVVDRFSIVTYTIEAERLCPLRQMTESTQKELQNRINNLDVDTSAELDITEGLKMALNILKDRSVSSGRVGAIMLMLAGEEAIGNAAAVPVGNVPVHTFGFGNGHDSPVLKAIANNSRLGGTYSDVRKDNLTLAFSQCLGGLLGVVAQDLTVTISQIKDESTIKQVSAGSYPQSMDNAAGFVTITFGDIYIQEVRKVLVKLHIPETEKKQSSDVLKVTYTYKFDGELFVASPETVTVCRMSGLRAQERQALPEVRAEEVCLLIAEVIKQATTDADEEDLRSAQDKLVNGLLKLEETDIEKLKAKLRPELEELLKLMQTLAIYKLHAHPFADSLLISLSTQRQMARGSNISKFQLFATPAMQEFLEEAKKLHDIDDPLNDDDDDDDEIIHDQNSGLNDPIGHGKVQLKICNNAQASLEENIQKVLLELSGVKNSQFGLDLVAVLDVSSSMEGVKLAKMKIAMLLLIKNLSEIDRLSIVEYSSKAKRLSPLRWMTESSQTKFENLIDDLTAQPGTNITDGLQMALNVLKDRPVGSARVSVIMLMSDGRQNQGGDAADVPVGNVHVLTFGFGEDQNPEVLISIADNSRLGGTYTDVCMDNMDLTFPHCLDQLQSVVVWDLTVTLTQIKNESTVKGASTGRFLQSMNNAAGSVTVTLGTLYIRQVCMVLVDIHLPFSKNEREADVLQVSYTYRSSFDGELCDANSTTVTVRRMPELTAERLEQHRTSMIKLGEAEIRLLFAEVIKQATGVADKEDLISVRDKLYHSLKSLCALFDGSILSLKKELEQLRDKLEELSELMQSQAINEKQGSSFAYSLLISNFIQRGLARSNGNAKIKIFGTPAMQEFVEQAKMYDEMDDLHVYIDRFIGAIKSIKKIIKKVLTEYGYI